MFIPVRHNFTCLKIFSPKDRSCKAKRHDLSWVWGQAALSTMFLISGIIVFAGVSIAFLSLSFLNASGGFQNANRAMSLANGGVQDALLQLERNKDFYDIGGYCVPSICGSDSAAVTVTRDSPIVGESTILSVATVSLYRARVQAVIAVDPQSGLFSVISWNSL